MKKTLLFLFLSIFVYADILDDKIKILVDPKTFVRHQGLINVIFRDRSSFFLGENIDYVKVVETLKENGLLEIFYPHPRNLTISFVSTISSDMFASIITNILRDMGYSYYITKFFKKDNFYIYWSINYVSDHVIDPVLFAKKLHSYNIKIHELSRKDNVWEYSLGSSMVTLADAKKVKRKDNFSMLNPGGEYWLELHTRLKKLQVSNKSSSYWYPKVILYDKNFKIIEIFKRNVNRRGISLAISPKVRFVKIADLYSSNALKRGIVVKIF